MHAECTGDHARDLPASQVALFGTGQTHFPVVPGRVYTVYAMAVAGAALSLLVDTGEHDRLSAWQSPEWVPLALFRVSDPRLPGHWRFADLRGSGGAGPYAPRETVHDARWGYAAILDDTHAARLAEREYDALLAFYRETVRRREAPDDGAGAPER
ncbi:hypothetical protein [Nocardiopsis coralliicola]